MNFEGTSSKKHFLRKPINLALKNESTRIKFTLTFDPPPQHRTKEREAKVGKVGYGTENTFYQKGRGGVGETKGGILSGRKQSRRIQVSR